MKPLSSKFGVVLLLLLSIFTCADGWGADWRFVIQTPYMTMYYDAQSANRPLTNIVRVWTKGVFTEEGAVRYVQEFGSRYNNIKYSLFLEEINCADKMERLLQLANYSNNGDVLESFTYYDKANWRFIPPGRNMLDVLYEALCR